ncbi:MAG: hypothetical protein K6T66_06330 [Peptococcaceae bacterium]|nr:hypothetical protein [Peptococcaceae bacterium]
MKRMRPPRPFPLDNIVAKMTLEEKVGQMIMASFRKWKDRDVTGINSEIARVVRDRHLGGVILFRENIVDPSQTVKLTDQIQRAAGDIPLFIATDQEGGRVVRLQTGTVMPGNMALGAARSPGLAYEVARAMGEELDSLGINVDPGCQRQPGQPGHRQPVLRRSPSIGG